MKQLNYKPGEFAKLLNVSVLTLQRWDNDRKLVAYRTPTNRRYYTHQQYLDYIAKSKNSSQQRRKVFGNEEAQERGSLWIGIEKESEQPKVLTSWQRRCHMLLLGPTGGGKFALTQLPMILQDIREPNRSFVYLDENEDQALTVYAAARHEEQQVVYINPLQAKSLRWNLLEGEVESVIETFINAFNLLLPQKENFFRDSSLKALKQGILALKLLYGDMADVSDLLAILADKKRGAVQLVSALEQFESEDQDQEKVCREVLYYFKKNYYRFIYEENSEDATQFHHAELARDFLQLLLANESVKTFLTLTEEESVEGLNFETLLENGTSIVFCQPSFLVKTKRQQVKIGKMMEQYQLNEDLIFKALLTSRLSLALKTRTQIQASDRHPVSIYLEEPFLFNARRLFESLIKGSNMEVTYHISCESLAALKIEESYSKNFLEQEAYLDIFQHQFIFPGVSQADRKVLEEQHQQEIRSIVSNLSVGEVLYYWCGEGALSHEVLQLNFIDEALNRRLEVLKYQFVLDRANR